MVLAVSNDDNKTVCAENARGKEKWRTETI